jgi:hypothetical protein
MADVIFRHAGGFGEVISIRVPKDLREEVRCAAEQHRLTIAEYCRRALARGIGSQKPGPVNSVQGGR